MLNVFIEQGLEEMRMSRLPYSGLAPPGDPLVLSPSHIPT